MIYAVMKSGSHPPSRGGRPRLSCARCSFRQLDKKPDKKKDQLVKPMAGPRATALRVTWLYISPDNGSQKVDRVQIGREMVVAEKSGPWMRVYANTDIEEEHPAISRSSAPTKPRLPSPDGWRAKGVVVEDTANGDQILMGAAANQEAEASDPRGPANAARSAHLLYRRLVEMFPNSPLAPEAAWRAADIQWQIQKSDFSALPSAKERDPTCATRWTRTI